MAHDANVRRNDRKRVGDNALHLSYRGSAASKKEDADPVVLVIVIVLRSRRLGREKTKKDRRLRRINSEENR